MVSAATSRLLLAVAVAAAAVVVVVEDLRTRLRHRQAHQEGHLREVHCVQVCWDRILDVVGFAQLRFEDCAERHDWRRRGEAHQTHFQDHLELQVGQKEALRRGLIEGRPGCA
jgi:hypothetical protein